MRKIKIRLKMSENTSHIYLINGKLPYCKNVYNFYKVCLIFFKFSFNFLNLIIFYS